jgi:hypothetical protein
MSKICLETNLQDVLQIYVFMTNIHIIGLKIGLKRHNLCQNDV